MMAVFADTSYYIALTNPRDEHHAAANACTESLDTTLVTTAWVLVELANSLSRGKNRAAFLALLGDLETDDRVTIVPPTSETFRRGIDLYARRSDKEWSLTDCISFLVMEQLRITDALTTDYHFEQAGFRLLLK
ncbi:MAG TPA: PIN domain-containing protein [Thermoguttaceae bacterium]|nr:PIN domain-containing protein [Thermoguttaceae bacterium]